MTDFASLVAADRGQDARTIIAVSQAQATQFVNALGEAGRAAVAAAGFSGKQDTGLFLPGGNGRDWSYAIGLGALPAPGRWTLATAAAGLADGCYRLVDTAGAALPAGSAVHGWLMAQHRFARYRKSDDARGNRQLLLTDAGGIDAALAEAMAAAQIRDLVDTPAEDLGPGDLEAAVRALAESCAGRVTVVSGEALIEQNFPAIHAVGRASPRRPRIISLDWGDAGRPLVALIGKGVCFDTGGLNLKPGNSMALMKKDMGGAAHALALARLVIERRLPIRLKLVIAAVDNAVSGDAIRPGDVIATRKGLTIEIGNTDAEGRLVLADALALAGEAGPALTLDFATLTGAARVALGPELPAMFTNDEALAGEFADAAIACEDPLWRLPLWQNYRSLFSSTIADLNNNAESGFAGAIVGALFLEHFVAAEVPWAHFDLFAWNSTARAGRPKGGAAMAIFAALKVIEGRFAR